MYLTEGNTMQSTEMQEDGVKFEQFNMESKKDWD